MTVCKLYVVLLICIQFVDFVVSKFKIHKICDAGCNVGNPTHLDWRPPHCKVLHLLHVRLLYYLGSHNCFGENVTQNLTVGCISFGLFSNAQTNNVGRIIKDRFVTNMLRLQPLITIIYLMWWNYYSGHFHSIGSASSWLNGKCFKSPFDVVS